MELSALEFAALVQLARNGLRNSLFDSDIEHEAAMSLVRRLSDFVEDTTGLSGVTLKYGSLDGKLSLDSRALGVWLGVLDDY